ncbi:MAG: FAA hydrolase family protein [Myxococcales bacterium]|nr:MAG: FAA hydrolase family protein [Myxococcales bacterium]
MKLFRFGVPGRERIGLLADQAGRVDVSAFGEDYDEAFFGTDGLNRLARWYEAHAAECPNVGADERIGPVVARPSKIVCVGLNFRDHAAETGAQVPTEPMLFTKSTTALAGPYDDLPLPRGSRKTDWEVELALVIGRRARYVEKARWREYVAGFTLMNDYSEREHQKERGGQFVKGKSADGFAPLGPLLVTVDEVAFENLRLELRVNGQPMQAGSTSDMIFDVPTLVSHISEFMTLLPGDVISTGTPAGVGAGRTPPLFLRPGDVVEYEGEGLGAARQRIVEPV